MKYVFLIAFQKANKNLIKVRTSDGKEVWATTSEAVYKYAKQNCKKDTEYEFQSEEKNGQLHISRVGSGDYQPAQQAPAPTAAPSTGGQRDAVGQSIEKQAMMKAAADAVATAMQGQVGDIDTLGDMIVKLYEKLLAKITA